MRMSLRSDLFVNRDFIVNRVFLVKRPFLVLRDVLLIGLIGAMPTLDLPSAVAQPTSESEQKLSAKPQCSYYRSKKEHIPVYAEADTTSVVVSKLKLGQEVCYIGEQGGFAIVDWRKKISKASDTPIEAKEKSTEVNDQNLVFVRLVDLWPPKAGRSLSTREPTIGERVTDFYNYLRNGGVPENPVLPFNVPESPLNRNTLPGDQPAPLPNQTPNSGADCGCGTGE